MLNKRLYSDIGKRIIAGMLAAAFSVSVTAPVMAEETESAAEQESTAEVAAAVFESEEETETVTQENYTQEEADTQESESEYESTEEDTSEMASEELITGTEEYYEAESEEEIRLYAGDGPAFIGSFDSDTIIGEALTRLGSGYYWGAGHAMDESMLGKLTPWGTHPITYSRGYDCSGFVTETLYCMGLRFGDGTVSNTVIYKEYIRWGAEAATGAALYDAGNGQPALTTSQCYVTADGEQLMKYLDECVPGTIIVHYGKGISHMYFYMGRYSDKAAVVNTITKKYGVDAALAEAWVNEYDVSDPYVYGDGNYWILEAVGETSDLGTAVPGITGVRITNSFYGKGTAEAVFYATTPQKETGKRYSVRIHKSAEHFAAAGENGFSMEMRSEAGVTFNIYAKDTILNHKRETVFNAGDLVKTVVTGEDGTAVLDEVWPGVYIAEEQPSDNGYLLGNGSDPAVQEITVDENEDTNAAAFNNYLPQVKVSVHKYDAASGEALAGAVFGLYAKTDVKDADGSVKAAAGTLIQKVTTDGSGNAEFTHKLPYGDYEIAEVEAPEGYSLSDKKEAFTVRYADCKTALIYENQFNFADGLELYSATLDKKDMDSPDADLSGAVYGVYADEDILYPGSKDRVYVKKDEQWKDIYDQKPAVLITDSAGHAEINGLAKGSYYIKEITAPDNYQLDEQKHCFTVPSEDGTEINVISYEKKIQTKLIIIKKDALTGKNILSKDTVFGLEKYTDGKWEMVEKLSADESGTAVSSALAYGKYRISEIQAPQGYYNACAAEGMEYAAVIEISDSSAGSYNEKLGCCVIEVPFENEEVKGSIVVEKTGELLCSYDKEKGFVYEQRPLSGAVFSIYAAEDIYTPDGQKDEKGNRVLLFKKGAEIAQATSGADGKAVFGNLALGSYMVKETAAPKGFICSGEEKYVKLEWKDQTVKTVISGMQENNTRIKAYAQIFKYINEKEPAAGAEFAVYNSYDIYNADGKCILKADSEIERAVSDAAGMAVFAFDLPESRYMKDADSTKGEMYYFKETKAPEGCAAKEGKVYTAGFFCDGKETADKKVIKGEVKNEVTRVEISKQDITDKKELPGAKLSIITKSDISWKGRKYSTGSVVESWVSSDKPHMIEGLPAGEYILREETAPYGYQKAEDAQFTVKASVQLQKTVMYDKRTFGRIIISKYQEDGNKKPDVPLKDAEFTLVYGSDVFDENGELVHKENDTVCDMDGKEVILTTDENGYAQSGIIEIFTYEGQEYSASMKFRLAETFTPYGYVSLKEPVEISFEYADDQTAIIEYTTDIVNEYTKVDISKQDITKKEELAGAELIITGEQDTYYEGKLYKAGETIVSWISETAPHRINRLPAGKYVLTEITAPQGYEKAEAVSFEIKDTGEVQSVVMLDAPVPETTVPETSRVQILGIEGYENYAWLFIAGGILLMTAVMVIVYNRKRS